MSHKKVTTDNGREVHLYSRIGMYNEKIMSFFNADGTDYDFSNVTVEIGVKKNRGDDDFVTLTEGDGITITNNDVHFVFTEAQSDTFKERPYYWQFRRTILGNQKVWMNGDHDWHNGKFDAFIDSGSTITINDNGDVINVIIEETGVSLFLGYFISLAALQAAYPTAEEGNYAYVDEGVGTDVVTYIWDETDQAWVEGGGGGGLDSFTVGNLSPLFTASLGADPLVNPALTFTQVNQNANLVYAGPSTGVAAAPTFRALVAADIPSNSTDYWKTTGVTTLVSNVQVELSPGTFSLALSDSNSNTGIEVIGDVSGESAVGLFAGSVALGTPVLTFLLDVTNTQGQGTGAKFIDGRGSPEGIQYGAAGYVTTDRTLTDRGYILGAKTYTGQQTFSLTSLYANNTGIDVITTGGSDVLNIGTSNADVINIGYSGSTINITGTLAYQNVTNLQVTDKLFTVNKGGGVGSGVSSGFEIEENNVITGYFATNGTRDGWDFKAPAITGVANLSLASLTGNRTYTLPDATGTFAVSASGNIALSAVGDITFTGILPVANGGTGVSTGAWLLASGGTLSGANIFTATGANNVTYNYATLGASTGFLLSSTSTDAASNTQTVFRVNQSGANGTASQTTFSGYFSNTKTGATSTNVALYAVASGGTTNRALQTLGSAVLETATSQTVAIRSSSGADWWNFDNNRLIYFNTAGGSDRITPITGQLAFQISGATAINNFQFVGVTTLTATSGTASFFALSKAITLSSGTTVWSQFSIGGTYNISGGTNTVIGVDYNPTITAFSAGTHLAFRATSGLSIFGGTTAADAWVVTGAGTTALAPLKFTSGTNLTTAVAGCFEYNGTNLFFTRTGTTRQTVLTANVITTEVVVNDTTITVNIAGTDYKLLARA